MIDIAAKARQIKCLICDVDGVLTDGFLYIDNLGHESKAFHVHDGMGLKLLMAAKINVAIITTSEHGVITHRLRQLGITHYFTGQIEKLTAFTALQERLGLQVNQFAYIGDDLPDLAIMKQVGLGVAVANAVPKIKASAILTTKNFGGKGAVREICDLILASQNLEELALTRYFDQ